MVVPVVDNVVDHYVSAQLVAANVVMADLAFSIDEPLNTTREVGPSNWGIEVEKELGEYELDATQVVGMEDVIPSSEAEQDEYGPGGNL